MARWEGEREDFFAEPEHHTKVQGVFESGPEPGCAPADAHGAAGGAPDGSDRPTGRGATRLIAAAAPAAYSELIARLRFRARAWSDTA